MATVSSETLILFIASILVAASVAGTMTTGVGRLADALGARSVDVSENVRTDVEIISDPSSDVVYENGTVTLLVKNTGSTRLSADPDSIDVLVDGRYRTNVSTTIIGASSWGVGDVLRVTVDAQLASGDHRAVIVVNENREVLTFRT